VSYPIDNPESALPDLVELFILVSLAPVHHPENYRRPGDILRKADPTFRPAGDLRPILPSGIPGVSQRTAQEEKFQFLLGSKTDSSSKAEKLLNISKTDSKVSVSRQEVFVSGFTPLEIRAV
jgi:hypothetical protein